MKIRFFLNKFFIKIKNNYYNKNSLNIKLDFIN